MACNELYLNVFESASGWLGWSFLCIIMSVMLNLITVNNNT